MGSTTNAPVLYLPIEHVQRELDGKLLVALEAVSRGYQVVLAEHGWLNRRILSLPVGMYLYKDAAGWVAAKLFPRLKKAGFKVAALDEEGIIFRRADAYLRERVSASAIANLDLLLAWGEQQHQVLLRKEGLDPQIIRVTGNPRMDLCRLTPRKLADDARPCILVNTRFALTNGSKPYEQVMDSLRRMGVIVDDIDEKFFADMAVRDEALTNLFIDTTRALAAEFPEARIVLRPHPGESSLRYQRALAGLNTVTVDNTTSLTRQLAEASVILHEGCTTAIEAALMGIPSVALAPTAPLSESIALPNHFSSHALSTADVIAQIRQILATPGARQPLNPRALEALKNAQGAYSFQLICDQFDLMRPAAFNRRELTRALRRGAILKDLRLRVRAWYYLKLLPMVTGKPVALASRRAASFSNKFAKFPPMSHAEMTARMEAVSAIMPGPAKAELKRINSQAMLLVCEEQDH